MRRPTRRLAAARRSKRSEITCRFNIDAAPCGCQVPYHDDGRQRHWLVPGTCASRCLMCLSRLVIAQCQWRHRLRRSSTVAAQQLRCAAVPVSGSRSATAWPAATGTRGRSGWHAVATVRRPECGGHRRHWPGSGRHCGPVMGSAIGHRCQWHRCYTGCVTGTVAR